MRQGRLTVEQIVGILKQHEASIRTTPLCRMCGVSETRGSASMATWRSAKPDGSRHPRRRTPGSCDSWLTKSRTIRTCGRHSEKPGDVRQVAGGSQSNPAAVCLVQATGRPAP